MERSIDRFYFVVNIIIYCIFIFGKYRSFPHGKWSFVQLFERKLFSSCFFSYFYVRDRTLQSALKPFLRFLNLTFLVKHVVSLSSLAKKMNCTIISVRKCLFRSIFWTKIIYFFLFLIFFTYALVYSNLHQNRFFALLSLPFT